MSTPSLEQVVSKTTQSQSNKNQSRFLNGSLNSYKQAESLSSGCFFNALLREWNGWTQESVDCHSTYLKDAPVKSNWIVPDQAEAAVSIPLNNSDKTLLIYIKHLSSSGRHQFINPIALINNKDHSIHKIAFTEAVELIIEENALWNTETDHRKVFLNRVKSSIENIQSVMEIRQDDLESVFSGSIDFQSSEQALFVGHSVHPTPKSRDQFTAEDSERFIPEYGNSFQLHWFSIDASLLEADSVHELSFHELTHRLADEDPEISNSFLSDIPEYQTLLPAHPWQAQQWLKNTYIQQLLSEGKLIDYGLHGSDWRATSSVRSIHATHASFMLKYSLSVKLTNSIRHLLPKEVIRGKEIHQVKYQTPVGAELKALYPDFEIITEPAHAAIKGGDGQVLPETMIVLRENPFNRAAINNCTELLASLTQDNPAGESRLINLIRELAVREKTKPDVIAQKWFGQYLSNVVEPLVIGQSDFGLLFGAHQQNLLIRMPQGYPEQAYFRDCQGTGYSHLARKLLKDHLPQADEEKEHHVSEQLGNRLFTYYLLINSTFGVISALGASKILPEKALLSSLYQFLNTLRKQGRGDTSCLDYILDSRELWSKGNFYCAYCNINENTLKDPMDVYHSMRNPLYEFSQVDRKND
ncbi:IucA/IucC family protein [Endozoicomonas arenosclerae]|uniref:IucA/IucC family protein n=1 Tax=Endozoicomonas arenosclerae TaxID=1633495 RepID=UPI00155F582C|nr:IucA/IucC family protein [Endozoicomonas arenosclerae]